MSHILRRQESEPETTYVTSTQSHHELNCPRHRQRPHSTSPHSTPHPQNPWQMDYLDATGEADNGFTTAQAWQAPGGNINFIKGWWKRVKWTNRCMHLAFINSWTISGWLLEYFCSSCGTKPHDPLSHNYSWNWSGSFQQCAGCNTGHHNQFPIDSIQCPMPSMEPNPN